MFHSPHWMYRTICVLWQHLVVKFRNHMLYYSSPSTVEMWWQLRLSLKPKIIQFIYGTNSFNKIEVITGHHVKRKANFEAVNRLE